MKAMNQLINDFESLINVKIQSTINDIKRKYSLGERNLGKYDIEIIESVLSS